MNLNSIAADHPVMIVDFWAEWCRPCLRLAPVLDSLVAETPGLTLLKVDIDKQPGLARQYSIMSVPTLLLFVGGEWVAQLNGSATLQELRSWVQPHIPNGITR